MNQPVPKVSADDVFRIVARDFSSNDASHVMSYLV